MTYLHAGRTLSLTRISPPAACNLPRGSCEQHCWVILYVQQPLCTTTELNFDTTTHIRLYTCGKLGELNPFATALYNNNNHICLKFQSNLSPNGSAVLKGLSFIFTHPPEEKNKQKSYSTGSITAHLRSFTIGSRGSHRPLNRSRVGLVSGGVVQHSIVPPVHR